MKKILSRCINLSGKAYQPILNQRLLTGLRFLLKSISMGMKLILTFFCKTESESSTRLLITSINPTMFSLWIMANPSLNSSGKKSTGTVGLMEETLEKLGVQHGCIHFEAKSTNMGAIPIEINLRMGGDYVHSYIKDAWDVDMIEMSVKIALGIYIKIEKPSLRRNILSVGIYTLNTRVFWCNLILNEGQKKISTLKSFIFSKKLGIRYWYPRWI